MNSLITKSGLAANKLINKTSMDKIFCYIPLKTTAFSIFQQTI